MDLRIRPVSEDDAAQIVDLLNPIIRAGTFTVLDEPATLEGQRVFIRDLPEAGIYHAAVSRDTGEIVGIQDVLPASPGVGEFSTFVALPHLRKGIGKRLCEATLEVARSAGYRTLRATIRADNRGAIAFYQGMGFERADHTPGSVVVAEMSLRQRFR